MKNINKLLLFVLSVTLLIIVTGCGSEDYSTYSGNTYKGKDPWGNNVTVNVKSIEGEAFEYVFDHELGDAETDQSIHDEGKVPFVKGSTNDISMQKDDNQNYLLNIMFTPKNGDIILKFSGRFTVYASDGASTTYLVSDLAEDARSVTLKKQ